MTVSADLITCPLSLLLCSSIPILILEEALARLLAELACCHQRIKHGRRLKEHIRRILLVPPVHDILARVQTHHVCRGQRGGGAERETERFWTGETGRRRGKVFGAGHKGTV